MFISKPILPESMSVEEDDHGRLEPGLPGAFRFEEDRLVVKALRRRWRSTKNDRGDDYLKRLWFEFETADGRIAVVYFDRDAKRKQPRWYLYTLSEGDPDHSLN